MHVQAEYLESFDSMGNYTTLNPSLASKIWMPDIFIGNIFTFHKQGNIFQVYKQQNIQFIANEKEKNDLSWLCMRKFTIFLIIGTNLSCNP